jgi:S1-C subfamily serine protease
MRTRLLFVGLCLAASAQPATAAGPRPEDSVVKVIASVRYPNPVRPWAKSQSREVIGSGVVIEGNKILTNAHLVLYATEVHVQARPGDDKIEAKVEAVGPDVDLALLTVKEAAFFRKRPPLARARKSARAQDNVLVYGFPVGGDNLSVTKGVISRVDFGFHYNRSPGMVVQVSAAINPGNSGGPAVVDKKMIGVVFSRLNEAENIGYVIPNQEIDLFLEDVRGGRYRGKPMEASGTDFQRLENAALRRMLGLEPSVKGVLVRPPQRPGKDYPLKEFDVLTKIGDYDIDNEGMVRLDDDFRVHFLCLVPKLARGNAIPVTVLRDEGPRAGSRTRPRKWTAVRASLPLANRDTWLLRDYEGEPAEYFIHGPLVFSPAKADAISLYARMNPALYAGNSPLLTRRSDRVRFPGEQLVVVTAPMFSHKIAKGYDDPVGQVVRKVNGIKVKNLRHLVETLRDCTDEFLTFRFADDSSDVLVFDRKEMDRVTEEILEENGIAPSRRGSAEVLKAWKKKAAPSR